MDLDVILENLHSRSDLADFVDLLRRDFEDNPEAWTNRDIGSYLEAMSAWLRDMDGLNLNLGISIPDPPTWRTVGEILLAAKEYE
ncbi:MAG: hypothetical protein KatS3mg053_2577 [Candidatus Roseilinea sp.]|nr:MAG: hypothetical protein KatS3mg053_2577 [Candidatus Roseilinea sp.]